MKPWVTRAYVRILTFLVTVTNFHGHTNEDLSCRCMRAVEIQRAYNCLWTNRKALIQLQIWSLLTDSNEAVTMYCLRLASLPGVILAPQLFRCHFNEGIELAVCLHLLMDLKTKAVVSVGRMHGVLLQASCTFEEGYLASIGSLWRVSIEGKRTEHSCSLELVRAFCRPAATHLLVSNPASDSLPAIATATLRTLPDNDIES